MRDVCSAMTGECYRNLDDFFDCPPMDLLQTNFERVQATWREAETQFDNITLCVADSGQHAGG